MSKHLRFTPDDYQSLCRASGPLSLQGPYAAFQRELADALRPSHPALSKLIRRLGKRQVRTLRMHLEAGRSPEPRPALLGEARSRCDLSIREWRTVSQACALLWLDDDCPLSFQGRLVGEVEHEEPALAAKLGRLDVGQVATLYRRIKAGKRWCD